MATSAGGLGELRVPDVAVSEVKQRGVKALVTSYEVLAFLG